MSRILIVCPTVTGREESLQRCKESYKRTLEDHTLRFSIPVDEESWGKGVNVGMEYADEVYGLHEFDYIHLTADDIEAHDGWLEAAEETLKKGLYPAPHLLNPDGSTFSFGHGDANMYDTSVDWKPTHTSVVPTFTPFMWTLMGPMIDLHYYTDDYLSHKARVAGFNTVARLPYLFTHHTEMAGRGAGMSQDERMAHDGAKYQEYLRTGVMP